MKKNIISFVFFVILTSCLANVTRHYNTAAKLDTRILLK